MSFRVLIVDDQAVIRGTLRLRFARLGCEVMEAANAFEGLQALQEFHPQLVTLDIVMPAINGLTALDLLRYVHATSDDTAVVVVSGKLDRRDEFLREGAIEFVAKPFESFDNLIRKLEPLIQVLDPGLSEKGRICTDVSKMDPAYA
jgi:CheY-like chemotaxis protein